MAKSEEIAFKGIAQAMFARSLYVAKDGYAWVAKRPEESTIPDTDPGEGPWLRERLPTFMPPENAIRDPSSRDRQNPGLHRLFASLDGNETGIRAFAKKWGQLGRKSDLELGAGGYAESLSYWRRELDHMKRLIALWELVRTRNEEALSPYVRWTPQPRQVSIYLALREGKLDPDGAQALVNSLQLVCPSDQPRPPLLARWRGIAEIVACGVEEHPYDANLLADWTDGEGRGPARSFLHAEVNRQLKGHVDPVITLPDKEGAVGLWFVPDTLLASLYVFFALELGGQLLEPRECLAEDCRKVFVPASTKQRYCTSMCRVRADAHRRRQKMQG
jgi:hypothetical protein